jgi:hypothetical protein
MTVSAISSPSSATGTSQQAAYHDKWDRSIITEDVEHSMTHR